MEKLIKELIGIYTEKFMETVMESITYANENGQSTAVITIIPHYKTVNYKRLDEYSEEELNIINKDINSSVDELIKKYNLNLKHLKFELSRCYSGDFEIRAYFR